MTSLSPPTFHSPIYEGSEIVGIHGMAGYRIKVYAKSPTPPFKNDFVGEGRVPWFGYGPIKLNRALKEGEVITATQSNNGDTSYPTWKKHAVIVEKIPNELLLYGEKFQQPKVVEPLLKCQRGFWVADLIEGVEVKEELSSPTTPAVHPWTPYQNVFVGVRSHHGLEENQEVRASQSFPSWPFPQSSDFSSPKVIVQSAPSLNDPKYKPVILTEDVSVGTTLLVVCNLITGAMVRIYAVDSSGTEVEFGGGIAGGACTKFPVQPVTNLKPRAQQWLCDYLPKSPLSDPVTLKSSIGLPEIEKPICAGAVEVTVHKTELRATVEIAVKLKGQTHFQAKGSKTAEGSTTTVIVADGKPLQEGDEVKVQQSNAILKSGWTDSEEVKNKTRAFVEVKNGQQHPDLPSHEMMFFRGVLAPGKYGPYFRAIMCSGKTALVRIIAPTEEGPQEIEVINLVEKKTGYFEGGWDWKHAGWNIPKDIPIGEYTARFEVTTQTGTVTRDRIFFVAFDPKEVSNNIVAATKSFKGVFPSAGESWTTGHGMNEAQVNAYFTGTPPKKVDCLGAVFLIMARGVITTVRSGEFDQLGYSPSNMNLIDGNIVQDISQLKIGERGYIRNDWKYLQKHPTGGYQGENIIKVSGLLYYGFPSGDKTYSDWVNELIYAYNAPPTSLDMQDSDYDSSLANDKVTTIPGFQGDSVWLLDVAKISIDVWNLRKP